MPTWRNPLSVWDAHGATDELPTAPYRAPQESWDKTRVSKVLMLPVGRLRYYYKWPGHGGSLWTKLRYWPTRRRVFHIRGEYNPKTMRRDKTIVDKRPIWWLLGFLFLVLAPLIMPRGYENTLLTAGSTFAIYAAINLCWMLVIGTAGIYSLASYAVVGAAAFGTAYLSIQYGVPWYGLPFIGAGIGLVFGLVIAIPATRLDGFYYALLTIGLNELCRVYTLQSKLFGSSTGGLYGADTYIPQGWDQLSQSRLAYYACFVLMLLALLLYRLINGRRLGRIASCAWRPRSARVLRKRPASTFGKLAFWCS